MRVYEERMDLLRAALVGAPGTPYHDGLFFFDIMLPPQYPHEPPVSFTALTSLSLTLAFKYVFLGDQSVGLLFLANSNP